MSYIKTSNQQRIVIIIVSVLLLSVLLFLYHPFWKHERLLLCHCLNLPSFCPHSSNILPTIANLSHAHVSVIYSCHYSYDKFDLLSQTFYLRCFATNKIYQLPYEYVGTFSNSGVAEPKASTPLIPKTSHWTRSWAKFLSLKRGEMVTSIWVFVFVKKSAIS